MNRSDARDQYLEMLAIWPAAKTTNGPDTANLWLEELTQFTTEHAKAAIAHLRISADWFPSVAQFHSLAVEERRAAQVHRAELEQPVDKEAALRARELVAAAAKPGRPITADMLDKAGVPNWRKRIAHALERDEMEMRNRVHYDEAWDAIRAEFVRAGVE